MKMRILIAALALLIAPQFASAQGRQNGMVPGQIQAVKVDGTVWQLFGSSGQRERLNAGDPLRQGSVVETAADGSAILLFDNGSTMNLRPSTKFSIDEFLRDPFEAQKMDYKNLKDEPTRSVTKVKVQDGTIFFDIPKLKGGSECEIRNPVGAAGIRGTAGVVATDLMLTTEGLVEVTTQTGLTQPLGPGQSTGFTPDGNFANATPQQLAAAVSVAIAANPGNAQAIAIAAAVAAAAVAPAQAAAIAAAVAAVVPAQAVAVAAAVAAAVPAQAAAIQTAVTQAVPDQASAIASAMSTSSGNNNTTTTGLGNTTQNTSQNPANLSGEQSAPTPAPTATPAPTPPRQTNSPNN